MTLLPTIFVAFFSAFIGSALKLGQDSWTRFSDSRALAATLAADIAATLSIARQRRYVEIIRHYQNELDAGRSVTFVDFLNNPEKLNAVFDAAISNSKLGLLGPKRAALVTKFFRQMNAIIGDIKRPDEANARPDYEKKEYLQQMLAIWTATVADGELAVSDLTKFAETGPMISLWNGLLKAAARRA